MGYDDKVGSVEQIKQKTKTHNSTSSKRKTIRSKKGSKDNKKTTKTHNSTSSKRKTIPSKKGSKESKQKTKTIASHSARCKTIPSKKGSKEIRKKNNSQEKVDKTKKAGPKSPANNRLDLLPAITNLFKPSDGIQEKGWRIQEWLYHVLYVNTAQKIFDQYVPMKWGQVPPGSYNGWEQEKNRKSCRYSDVPCLEKTRVLIKGKDDFYHANFVGAGDHRKRFICCQGPTNATVNSFWKMVWEQEVKLIVMLCNEIEDGAPKCARYYPTLSETVLCTGEFRIQTLSFNCLIDSITFELNAERRKFLIQKGDEQRQILHFCCTSWRDKNVPLSVEFIIHLLKVCRSEKYSGAPAIVHCSAGIGRTGTFVFIEHLLLTLANSQAHNDADKIDSPVLLENMRQERVGLVQTPMQYLFAHLLVVIYLQRKGKADLFKPLIKDFRDDYIRLWYQQQEQCTQLEYDARDFRELPLDILATLKPVTVKPNAPVLKPVYTPVTPVKKANRLDTMPEGPPAIPALLPGSKEKNQ